MPQLCPPPATTDPRRKTTTVISVVPLTPPLVAITLAEPESTPVTSPVASTVATLAASVVQTTERPGSTLPFASRTVADRRLVSRASSVADVGVTVTDPTGGGVVTVTNTVPLAVPLVARIVAFPRLTPVTVAAAGPMSPELCATEATDGALLVQVIDGYVITRPRPS